MAKLRKTDNTETPNSFRFNLTGLVIFSLALIAGTAMVSCRMFDLKSKAISFVKEALPDPDMQDKDFFTRKGPWGELLTQNIDLERPQEYISQDINNIGAENWTFNNMNLDQVKALLMANGLTEEQVEVQLNTNHVAILGSKVLVTPDEDFLVLLKPEIRGRLYNSFQGLGVGTYIDSPYIFPNDAIQSVYKDSRLVSEDVALLKKLVYPSGNSFLLSDFEVLMQKITTPERRMAMAKVLSMQPAVLTRLCVRPDSDIDKIASYWGFMDNVRFTDVRPMLEALKKLPKGGSISLMYVLPPFARSRLYTYPLPPQPNDPPIDCHWSTFNFSNKDPDDRFHSPEFMAKYINDNFYQIDSPSVYGDIILYMNDKKEMKHSAVYLADDLAFTKYGNNYRQPWMVVRIAEMQTFYPSLKPYFFRRKTI